ncbi:MAG TPA: hypothetical protein VGX28_15430 [Frankiaceae bacterium]|nr:hypothetical protein [Frankiaceae bacterium]
MALSVAAVPALPASAEEPVAPAAPPTIEVVPTPEGPRLAWGTAPTGGGTGYAVYRQRTGDAAPAKVTTVPASTESYVDADLARGEQAVYSVATVQGDVESTPRTAPSFTRLAADPAVGTTDAHVDDTGAGVVVNAGLARTGDRVHSDTTTVTLPRVGGPGTYDATGLAVTRAGSLCTATSGSIAVDEVLYDAAGALLTYAASWNVDCAGTPTHGLVRWHSARPYQGVRGTVPAGEWRVPSGSYGDRTLTFASVGDAPVTFGAATLSGADAASFAIQGNACEGQSLAGGATCDVVVRATVSGATTRTATVALADDTARGTRGATLSAIPSSVPGAPANVGLFGLRIGVVSTGWQAPASDGNSPVTAYRVYRRVGDGEPEALAQVPASSVAYDDARPPGSTQRYGVSAVNAMGEGPVAWLPHDVDTPGTSVIHGVGDASPYGMAETVPYGVVASPYDVGGADVRHAAVSPDGTKIAYARAVAVADGDHTSYDLYLRNADGTGTPVNLTGGRMGGQSEEYWPAFSNDGRWIAFTREFDDTISVWHVSVNGGVPVHRGDNVADPTWLPDSRSLVVTDYTSATAPLVRIAPNNARTAVPGTTAGEYPDVSPDGRWLAFAKYNEWYDVYAIGVLPVTGGTPKWMPLGPGAPDRLAPAWDGTGRRLAYTLVNNDLERIAVGLADWDGSTLSAAGLVVEHPSFEPAWRSVGMRFTSAPYAVAGSVTVGIALSSPFPSATCTLDAQAGVPCTTSFSRSGLTAGTHTLVVRATYGAYSRVLSHTFTVDRAGPVITMLTPTALFHLGTSVGFRWSATDATGVVAYDVRYRRAPYNGGFGGYTTSSNRPGPGYSIPTTRGSTYCLSVRARDTLGNYSGWTAERCSTMPLDDRSLSVSSGWSRGSMTGYYASTYTASSRLGATMTLGNVSAKRLAVVATRCYGCGSVAVYIGTSYVGTVNLSASTTQHSYVAVLPAFASVRTGTVTLRVTTSGRAVQVDGLGVSKA